MRTLLLLLPLFASCYSIKPERMVPDQTDYGAKHQASVALDVEGGSGGAWLYSGTLKASKLGEAIRMSIEKSGLFGEVAGADVADYILDVDLKYGASHPGFTMTGKVIAQWALIARATSESLWSAEIEGSGKATVGDAFNGGTRQYMAIERAGKAHIEKGLSQVGAVGLARP